MLSLRAARVNAGYTQKRAAELIGVNVSTLIKWENGVTYPTVIFFKRLCGLYSVSVNDIFLKEA